MKKALDLARQALASGEFPVGCIVVHENEIVSTGSRIGPTGGAPNEIDHAEMVALRNLANRSIDADPGRMTLYCTLEPCLMCFGAILLSNIGKIVYAYEDVMGGGTGCDLNALNPLYKNHSVSILSHVLRTESLDLLKTYFSDPRNSYWRGSLLSEYTLAQ